MPKFKNAKIPKCKNAAKTQKYNNAKLKIVSNVVRGPSCLSFPKPLGTVPLVPRASRRGFSNAKIPKYTKIPKCQNAAKMPKCQNATKCHKNATKMPQKYKNTKMQISRKENYINIWNIINV